MILNSIELKWKLQIPKDKLTCKLFAERRCTNDAEPEQSVKLPFT